VLWGRRCGRVCRLLRCRLGWGGGVDRHPGLERGGEGFVRPWICTFWVQRVQNVNFELSLRDSWKLFLCRISLYQFKGGIFPPYLRPVIGDKMHGLHERIRYCFSISVGV